MIKWDLFVSFYVLQPPECVIIRASVSRAEPNAFFSPSFYLYTAQLCIAIMLPKDTHGGSYSYNALSPIAGSTPMVIGASTHGLPRFGEAASKVVCADYKAPQAPTVTIIAQHPPSP